MVVARIYFIKSLKSIIFAHQILNYENKIYLFLVLIVRIVVGNGTEQYRSV